MQQPAEYEYDDPIRNLEYQSQITTRDVAALIGVTQATVRRWVARGHISPIGKLGSSHLFNPRDVIAAHDNILSRHKASGRRPRGKNELWVEPRPADRIKPKHYDAIVGVDEAARLVDVKAATIRSWIHRGHLAPLKSSSTRGVRLRLGDVVIAAQQRQSPQRAPRPAYRSPRSAT